MKKHVMMLILLSGLCKAYGQTFINGDFENNISNGCDYNNTDVDFNTKISNVYAFGRGRATLGYVGETDLQTTGCYVTPQNGNWCLGLSSDTASTADAVAIELTSNLIIGQAYQISFYVFGNSNFNNGLVNLNIGVSNNRSTFGNLLHTAVPDLDSWKRIVFNFTASQSSRFITVAIASGVFGWNQIDNFTISNPSGISDYNVEDIHIYPNPFTSSTIIQTGKDFKDATLAIYNLSGQQVKEINNISGQTITVNRDDLPSGLYLIRLIQDNKVIVIDKLVITD